MTREVCVNDERGGGKFGKQRRVGVALIAKTRHGVKRRVLGMAAARPGIGNFSLRGRQ